MYVYTYIYAYICILQYHGPPVPHPLRSFGLDAPGPRPRCTRSAAPRGRAPLDSAHITAGAAPAYDTPHGFPSGGV